MEFFQWIYFYSVFSVNITWQQTTSFTESWDSWSYTKITSGQQL
jgi:hypothetical protein